MLLQHIQTWLKNLWLGWVDPDALPYVPRYLKLWKYPPYYMGAQWDGWCVFPESTNRDADLLQESNWDCIIRDLGGENPCAADEERGLLIVEETHFLCGWVKWMGIHSTDYRLLRKADAIAEKLQDYPVWDEDDFGQRESEEQYRLAMEALRDFNNSLYKYEDPDTGNDLEELNDEETEFIAEMFCQSACDFSETPNEDSLWEYYWKVKGHLLHCMEHGTFLENDPCPCQERMPA